MGNIRSKSRNKNLPVLPIELWSEIIAYTPKYPNRFNLRNVCSQMREIIDRCQSIPRANLLRYCNLNRRACLDKQITYILHKCDKQLFGLYIPRCESEVVQSILLSGVTRIVTHAPTKLTTFRYNFVSSYVGSVLRPMVRQCVFLEVLELVNSSDENRSIIVDIGDLKQLKILRGNKIYFRNCKSLILTELQYDNLRLNDVETATDCQRMLMTSETIEHLYMQNVKLSHHDNGPAVICHMPKLKQVIVLRSRLCNVSINLSDSANFNHLCIADNSDPSAFSITGFDLALHRIRSLKVISNDVIIQEFVFSATCDPMGLCYIEEFTISRIPSQLLVQLLNCFSHYSDSLRRFSYFARNDDAFDFRPLCTLISRAKNLVYLNLDNFVIHEQALVQMIMAKVRLNVALKFRCQINSAPEFLSHLFDALSSASPALVRRKRSFLIYCCYIFDDIRLMNLMSKIRYAFGITFMFINRPLITDV